MIEVAVGDTTACSATGWLSHILIDVFTHSADYSSSPVLYPNMQRGFDGLAWSTPWFLVPNYAVLCTVGWWRWTSRSTARSGGAMHLTAVARLARDSFSACDPFLSCWRSLASIQSFIGVPAAISRMRVGRHQTSDSAAPVNRTAPSAQT